MTSSSVAPAPTPARTFDGPTCPVHGWPLRDGACGICEGRRAHGVEPALPLPPVDAWPRPVRAAILAALEQRTTQFPHSDPAARREGSWAQWLRSAAADAGLVSRHGKPHISDHEVYTRFAAEVERLTAEGT